MMTSERIILETEIRTAKYAKHLKTTLTQILSGETGWPKSKKIYAKNPDCKPLRVGHPRSLSLGQRALQRHPFSMRSLAARDWRHESFAAKPPATRKHNPDRQRL